MRLALVWCSQALKVFRDGDLTSFLDHLLLLRTRQVSTPQSFSKYSLCNHKNQSYLNHIFQLPPRNEVRRQHFPLEVFSATEWPGRTFGKMESIPFPSLLIHSLVSSANEAIFPSPLTALFVAGDKIEKVPNHRLDSTSLMHQALKIKIYFYKNCLLKRCPLKGDT